MAMYKDSFAALYATVDDPDVLITSSNGVPVMSPTKSRIVDRIPNDFSIVDSAWAATMLMRFRSKSRHPPRSVYSRTV
jgi:hypothetical protein